MFGLCGMSLVYGDSVTSFAETLDRYEIDIITKWLNQQHHDDTVWSSERLTATALNDLVDLRDRAGLMAVRLLGEADKNGWMLMFRKARLRQYQWLASRQVLDKFTVGGLTRLPDLPVEVWQETITDRSDSWRSIEQKAALDLAEDLTVAISVNEISQLNKQLHLANAQLKEIAHTDSLTQVWNRYRIEQTIDAELSAAERYDRPTSVLLFDVDNFKRVNDQFGHEIGDEVLKKWLSKSMVNCGEVTFWAAGVVRNLLFWLPITGLMKPVISDNVCASILPISAFLRLVMSLSVLGLPSGGLAKAVGLC